MYEISEFVTDKFLLRKLVLVDVQVHSRKIAVFISFKIEIIGQLGICYVLSCYLDLVP